MRIDVSDAELAGRAAEGDPEAFGALVDRHALTARRLARALLHHHDDADDAAQEAFLSAWRFLGRYDPARPFRPWLMRIVVNAAHDLRRRRRLREMQPLAAHMTAQEISPEQSTDRAILRSKLGQALARLPERQRVALLMFDAEGYSHAEIAAVLDVPEGTVRSDVFHARRALRGQLPELSGEAV